MTLPSSLLHEFKRGLDLFNRAHFFDAHEALEDVWRPLPRDRPLRRHLRLHVQGYGSVGRRFPSRVHG